MAPSQVPTSAAAPKSLVGSAKKQTESGDETVKVLDGSRMMSDGTASEEEVYWAHHPPHPGNEDDDDHHLHGENDDDDNQDYKHRSQPQRPTRIRSSTGSNRNINRSNNTSSIKSIPEVRYAKPGIVLSQTNIIRDRGGGAGAGDGRQVQPGETLYFSSSTSNKATGQYQLHQSYSSSNNGDLNNGQTNNNYNNLNGNGNNGGGHPQPHPYNINGVGSMPQYPPFLQYPHPRPGAPYPINYYDPHGEFAIASNTTSENELNVRGEEVGIVLVVLLLWVGAIILFFNRWGKIRMLEPYQPKFCENHRPSCPMAEVTAISNHPRTFSKFNLSTEMLAGPNGTPHFVKCNYHGIPSADPAPGFSGLASTGVGPGGLIIPGPGFPSGGSTGMLNSQRNAMMMNHHLHHHHHHSRPRQNSVFVTSPSSQISFYGSDTTLKNSGRKTKSAVDLPTLVLTGEFMDNARRNSKNSITQL